MKPAGTRAPRAVPWKSSDLPPLLHAEAPGPVAAAERGKAFVGNAGRACDKLAAQTPVRTGLHTGAGGDTAAHPPQPRHFWKSICKARKFVRHKQ